MLEHVGGLGPALLAGTTQLSDSGIRGFSSRDRGPTGPWDGPAGRIVGPELKELFADVDRLLVVAAVTDDHVEPHNRVLRSALPADEHGPIPKVVLPRGRRSARTVANREFLAHKAAELMRAAGAKHVSHGYHPSARPMTGSPKGCSMGLTTSRPTT
jgi:hypothetical protein